MLKTLSTIGYIGMIGGLVGLLAMGDLISPSPVVISLQVVAVLLFLWARVLAHGSCSRRDSIHSQFYCPTFLCLMGFGADDSEGIFSAD